MQPGREGLPSRPAPDFGGAYGSETEHTDHYYRKGDLGSI